jgi:hypothetical protein
VSDEKIKHKDYTRHASRVLNRLIKIRIKQIESLERGSPTSDKTLAQLRYELQAMTNTLMERSLTRVPETKD